MKLPAFIIAATANADYTPPKFKQLMQSFKDGYALGSDGQRAQGGQIWGHPVTRGYLDYSTCPEIELPAGADHVKCNQSSCAVECKGGYTIVGNPRTKCKRGKKGAPNYWRRPLGHCKTCDGGPSFSDPKVWQSCWVEPKNNRRVCKFGCTLGADLVGSKKAECKCSKKNKSCEWSIKRKPADWSKIRCEGGAVPDKDGLIPCAQKSKKCTDVTSETTTLNSWTCRNCFRMRSEWHIPPTFDNRDHMVMNFSENVQIQNFAHPMKTATNPSGDLRTWYIEFSEEAQFGDRRIDFTSEWRYFEKPARLTGANSCPCSNDVPN